MLFSIRSPTEGPQHTVTKHYNYLSDSKIWAYKYENTIQPEQYALPIQKFELKIYMQTI